MSEVEFYGFEVIIPIGLVPPLGKLIRGELIRGEELELYKPKKASINDCKVKFGFWEEGKKIVKEVAKEEGLKEELLTKRVEDQLKREVLAWVWEIYETEEEIDEIEDMLNLSDLFELTEKEIRRLEKRQEELEKKFRKLIAKKQKGPVKIGIGKHYQEEYIDGGEVIFARYSYRYEGLAYAEKEVLKWAREWFKEKVRKIAKDGLEREFPQREPIL